MPPAPATRVIFFCRLWDVVALSARDSPLAHTFRGTQAERAFVSLALTHFAESNHASFQNRASHHVVTAAVRKKAQH